MPHQSTCSHGPAGSGAAPRAVGSAGESGPPKGNACSAVAAGERRVLVVDDDREMCELTETGLSQHGYVVHWRPSAAQALDAIDHEDFGVLLADIHMDRMTGIELCRAALAKRPDLVVVVMTGLGSLDHAISAMRAGAYDFVSKPISMSALAIILERAFRHRTLTDELRRLRQRVDKPQLPDVLGDSPEMTRVADLVNRVADTDANILITGESGTGKELVARAIHQRSGRSGPFLAINCASVPETLLESELFGHVRGAFTGAHGARTGLFVEAHQGTLFLDEIGDMPIGMQTKILRAIQERRVRPLGATAEVPFDARLITATNRDLEGVVLEKRFREDLYYRINVVRVDLPPLRLRGKDVLLLAQHFLDRGAARMDRRPATVGRLVAERLISYDWPGNVRELENCMERALALARYDEITLEDLPPKIREHRPTEVLQISDDPNDLPPMAVVEERYIRKVLGLVGGNKVRAAKILGFNRRTLYRKLRRLAWPDLLSF
jgi:two-component system response regulator AtoC